MGSMQLPEGLPGHEPPVRASDADRDRTIRVLRRRSVEGRLSPDTFVGRVDIALQARSRGELDDLVSDLPRFAWLRNGVTDAVAGVSRWTATLRSAWRAPRLPRLALPGAERGIVTIGRGPDSDLLVADVTVSRRHAELCPVDGGWLLVDLGSTNGTRVNGLRVAKPTAVRPGDHITFGRVSFRLAGH